MVIDGLLLTCFLKACAENYKVPLRLEIDPEKLAIYNTETEEKISETKF